ncbi:MAG: GNAT family N-acetyltransferase [Armatimonadota bacterium]
MDDSARIRPAIEDDALGLWQLRAAAIRHGAREHYSPEQIEVWVGRRTPESYHASIRKGRIVAAEDANGTVVGFGQLEPETREVEAVYVQPAWTRRGIGTRLLRTLEERARTAGLERLHLDASLNAVPFYEQSGYRIEHEVLHPLGARLVLAFVFMTKPLG